MPEIVESKSEYADAKRFLTDDDYLQQHDKLRDKYFLPARPLLYHTDKLEDAQLHVTNTSVEVFSAEEKFAQVSRISRGRLGLARGAQITGEAADPAWVEMRQVLIGDALDQLFEGRKKFDAC